MASRTPSRSGRSGRSSSNSSSSNQTAMMFGGIGIAVVATLIVVMSGGAKKDTADAAPKAPAASSTVTPAAAPAAAAKAGKTPATPAPALTAETLQKVRDLLAEAKALSNEGVTARNAGNNELARSKQSAASDKVEAIKAMTKTQWAWQEQAELGDWTLPAEYVALGNLYTDVSKLENQIRKGGGTR